MRQSAPFSSFRKETYPSAAAGTDFNSDSANFASAVPRRPLSGNGMYGSELGIRQPSSSPEARGAICAPSLLGALALLCGPREFTLFPDYWGLQSVLCGVILPSHGPSLEYNLLDMKPAHMRRLPYTSRPVFY